MSDIAWWEWILFAILIGGAGIFICAAIGAMFGLGNHPDKRRRKGGSDGFFDDFCDFGGGDGGGGD